MSEDRPEWASETETLYMMRTFLPPLFSFDQLSGLSYFHWLLLIDWEYAQMVCTWFIRFVYLFMVVVMTTHEIFIDATALILNVNVIFCIVACSISSLLNSVRWKQTTVMYLKSLRIRSNRDLMSWTGKSEPLPRVCGNDAFSGWGFDLDVLHLIILK